MRATCEPLLARIRSPEVGARVGQQWQIVGAGEDSQGDKVDCQVGVGGGCQPLVGGVGLFF